ncbi:hypothetical protein ASPZODRAFT_55828 [Penicilliopsis zonata CBS 506.65]|uniref:Killer toxin Kp4 domain-containing protein n=1 Tax=Penicilliopsis zonata CBS 506.65 TaxID=1073090 RepID=A0A1L9SU98_9EURO|nr:hypothetical protein ASPZODRAFT_55828 [Penicilliopsis zonata CBS 506.65]OJJ50701.1 hypothetical protein ASPZODRAFT_55828 [Penicilliopsis zonata CBS 506.65]
MKSIAFLLLAVPLSLADNCRPNIQYCGYNLLKRGNYYAQINDALRDANQPTDETHVDQGLFWCTGGANGEITFISFCQSGCHDGGTGRSDWCN